MPCISIGTYDDDNESINPAERVKGEEDEEEPPKDMPKRRKQPKMG